MWFKKEQKPKPLHMFSAWGVYKRIYITFPEFPFDTEDQAKIFFNIIKPKQFEITVEDNGFKLSTETHDVSKEVFVVYEMMKGDGRL